MMINILEKEAEEQKKKITQALRNQRRQKRKNEGESKRISKQNQRIRHNVHSYEKVLKNSPISTSIY